MLNNRIAVIGDKDSILAFKAVGADVFSVKDKYDAEETGTSLVLFRRSFPFPPRPAVPVTAWPVSVRMWKRPSGRIY